MRKENLPKIVFYIIDTLDQIFLKLCPVLYMGLTRAQDSNDRFIFGSDMIKKFKNNNKINVLDVGCGSGNFYAYLKSLSNELNYFGIEFSENQIKSSKFKQKNFNLKDKDLRKDWFFGEFDFVWSSEVIEHIKDDNLFFQKLVKSTKKEGYIIITSPHYDSYINFANKYGWSKTPSLIEDGGHVKLGYNEEELNKFASKFNLKLIDIFFISECDDYRSKNFFKFNAGLKCYVFNFLYFLRIFNYKRYVSQIKSENKLNYFCIGAVFKK